MKYGFVFECGPSGADIKVIKNLVNRILPDVIFEPATLDDKGTLLEKCADAADGLLNIEKCDKVFIIWDLIPPDKGACRKEDRDLILAKVNAKGLPLNKIVLLCIEKELESWLIADGRALSNLLSTAAHPKTISDTKKPDEKVKPKKALNKIFREHRGWYYIDTDYAESIVKRIPDFNKLKRSVTFKRFYFKLTGQNL